MEKREPLCTAGENVNWGTHYGKQCGGSYITTVRYRNSTSGNTCKGNENTNSKNICTLMFIETLLTIAKTWKQPKRPSTDDWIKKAWYVDMLEYYSAIKKNEIMPFAATWMDLDYHTK